MIFRKWTILMLTCVVCLCGPAGIQAADLFSSGWDSESPDAEISETMEPVGEEVSVNEAGQAEEETEAASDGFTMIETDPETELEEDSFLSAFDDEALAGITAQAAEDEEEEEAAAFGDTDMVSDGAMSGKCGAKVTYTLTPSGAPGIRVKEGGEIRTETAMRLTLSGSGPMTDYDWEEETILPPWEPYDIYITEVVFAPGSSITHIGNWAFYHFANVESIVFPDSVTSIGDGAVTDCTTDVWGGLMDSRGLKSVTIPRSVTSIGRRAFTGNNRLETVNFNGTLRELGAICYKEDERWNCVPSLINAFRGAPFLGKSIEDLAIQPGQEIRWDASNFPYVATAFLDIGKTGISENGWYLVKVHATGKTYTDVTLFTEAEDPEDNREDILTGQSVRTNQNGERLSDTYFFPVRIPSGSTGKKLGIHIVTQDDELSKNMTVSFTIDPWKKGLVTEKGSYGSGVSWELSVIDPEGISGYDPRHDDSWDGHWTQPSLALTIKGSGAMHDLAHDLGRDHRDPSQEHTPWEMYGNQIRKVTVGNGITHIGDFAFAWLSGVREISIPNTVTSIGHHAFAWCQEGEGEGENFHATDGLKTITIPASVKTIGQGAFEGQTLETVSYGSGTIVSFAGSLPQDWGNFYFERLRRLFSKGSPASDKYCEAVKGAVVLDGTCGKKLKFEATLLDANGEQRYDPNHDENWDGIWYWFPVELKITGTGAMNDYFFDFSIPREDPSIIDPPWNRIRDNITKLTLSKGITHIGEYAFKSLNHLSEVKIPDGVVSIGRQAFRDCNMGTQDENGQYHPTSSILTLTLPKSLTFIGQQAFVGNPLLETVNYPGTLKELAAVCEAPKDADRAIARLAEVFPPASPWAGNTFRPAQLTPGKAVTLYTKETDLARNGTYDFRLSDLGLPAGTYHFAVTLTGRGGMHVAKTLFDQQGNRAGDEVLEGRSIEDHKVTSETMELDVKLDANTWYHLLVWTSEKQENAKVTASFTMESDAGKPLSACTVTLSYTSKTYTGKALKPKVTVKDGKATVPSGAYSVSYKNNTHAGTATVTVKAKAGKGYVGSQSVQFTIKKAKSLKVPKTSYTKNASTKTQSFALGATAKGRLTYQSSNKSGATVNSAGKVTIKKNFVGTVKITVKAAATKDYRAETKTVSIKVRPASASLTYAKSNARKKMTVKWKKNTRADGYQIQYATSKDFKTGKKTKRITSSAKSSAVLSSLTSGKTYYVRIRTYKKVSGKNYYSAWSDILSAVVK